VLCVGFRQIEDLAKSSDSCTKLRLALVRPAAITSETVRNHHYSLRQIYALFGPLEVANRIGVIKKKRDGESPALERVSLPGFSRPAIKNPPLGGY
jgi:hypothetical protein